jgi:hypothetical protein
MEQDQAAATNSAGLADPPPPADEAPYGLTADGAPRAKPGRKPGQRTGTGRQASTAKKTIPAPPRKATPIKPPAAKSTTTDYRPAIKALLGEGVGSLAVIGLMRDEMTLVADAATIADAVPALADVTNLAAEKWPVVAAILDRFLPLAASAKSGGTILLMAAQLAVNHGKMPPGLIPGTVSAETKVSKFIADQIAVNPDFAAMIAGIQATKGTTYVQAHSPADNV